MLSLLGETPEKGRKGTVLHGKSWSESPPWADSPWNRKVHGGTTVELDILW